MPRSSTSAQRREASLTAALRRDAICFVQTNEPVRSAMNESCPERHMSPLFTGLLSVLVLIIKFCVSALQRFSSLFLVIL